MPTIFEYTLSSNKYDLAYTLHPILFRVVGCRLFDVWWVRMEEYSFVPEMSSPHFPLYTHVAFLLPHYTEAIRSFPPSYRVPTGLDCDTPGVWHPGVATFLSLRDRWLGVGALCLPSSFLPPWAKVGPEDLV